MSVTQGGCGIPFIAPLAHNYIHVCTGKLPSCADIPLEDIPFPNLKYVLEKVKYVILLAIDVVY